MDAWLRVWGGSGETIRIWIWLETRLMRSGSATGADGEFAETALDHVVPAEVADGLPVRECRSYEGRLHFSG
jgi:hypothetical protein